eukprot:4640968-Alexandrium_andersonii.AAC.1
MSASLVGSEMCIRDSDPRFRDDHRLVQEVGQPFIIRPAQVVRVDEVHAVSYTHLTLPTICSV